MPMEKHIRKKFGFLKTTALGGAIFLLPLIVIGALLGQVVQVVLVVAEVIGKWIPLKSAGGIALLILLALAVVVLMCFVAGLAARRSFGKRISQTIEKNLLLFFPRYTILKDQMAGGIGSDETKPRLKPVLVKLAHASRIAFEVERPQRGLVTIYLPGAPDPWSGSVVYMTADRVEPLEIGFSEAVATLEKLGRDSTQLLANQERKGGRHAD